MWFVNVLRCVDYRLWNNCTDDVVSMEVSKARHMLRRPSCAVCQDCAPCAWRRRHGHSPALIHDVAAALYEPPKERGQAQAIADIRRIQRVWMYRSPGAWATARVRSKSTCCCRSCGRQRPQPARWHALTDPAASAPGDVTTASATAVAGSACDLQTQTGRWASSACCTVPAHSSGLATR